GARIEVRQLGRETCTVSADASGNYEIAVPARSDLFVTTGKLSAYQLGFQPVRAARQELDWTLADTQSGAVSAAGRDVPLAPPRQTEDGPPYQLPAATNRALHLDGNDGYVELPANIFNDLDEATIETWAKVDLFAEGSPTRFFNYGRGFADISLGVQETPWFLVVDPQIPRVHDVKPA